jgi:flavin-dependent thymidylate synthase
MKIILAGYNVDKDVLDELKGQSAPRCDVTPETLSAAYARISRDPRPADALRRAAREEVEKARRSNRAIIFKMGHHSVAEHAVFNFDIIGASRLAIEEIERFRLCSYTEKSQRYITLGSDYVVPAEIRDAGEERLFVKIVKAQNALYHAFYRKLRPFVFAQNPALARDPKKHNLLDGWAREDARYIVSLATEGQLGLTVNARNLELMIRRFAASRLAEIRDFGRRLHDLAGEIAPSIVLFTAASDFDAKTYEEFAAAAARALEKRDKRGAGADPVKLIEVSRRGDDTILAALLHSVSGLAHKDCRARVKALTRADKKAFFRAAFARMEFYDFPLREFEYADLSFELILSASAFAQLKRHRMATLTRQDYDPDLGATVPPSIEAVGARREFMDMIVRTDEAYETLKAKAGGAAAYVLTNAHRRRVLLKISARELYHVSRLREDAAAQWDIRELAARMTALARKEMPLSFMMAGGKDGYPRIYEKIFGKSPAARPPEIKK